jgi:hypothetical protein
VKPSFCHFRPAASSRARTASQDSSSAVPASTSSMRFRISSLQASAAPVSVRVQTADQLMRDARPLIRSNSEASWRTRAASAMACLS